MAENELCTFAATGATPAFQAIYICNTCSEKNICSSNGNNDDNHNDDDVNGNGNSNENDGKVTPLCICQNCAEHCHESQDHDVEYYGLGPCYCDCSSFHHDVVNVNGRQEQKGQDAECYGGCVLQEKSQLAAKKLGISSTYQNSEIGVCGGVNYTLKEKPQEDGTAFPFFCQTLSIPSLQALPCPTSSEINPCDRLIDQALAFIQHSTDTHWIPHNFTTPNKHEHVDMDIKLSALEQLAYSIFHRHIDAYNLRDMLGPHGGAEWWVQIKKTNQGDNANDANAHANDGPKSFKKEAIDLHYDKDEALAEAFDLGSFPTLSTVTYLSGSILENEISGEKVCAAPTLVFPHTYEMTGEGPIGSSEESEEMEDDDNVNAKPAASSISIYKQSMPTPKVVISHARTGKHLVFDGRLLHGAPSDRLLRQDPDTIGEDSNASSLHKGIRVTFLVNIWLTRRPSKVTILPADIRSNIMDATNGENGDMKGQYFKLQMIERDATNVNVHDRKGSSTERIDLPFVSSGATWIAGEDGEESESESGLVVRMIPPEKSSEDTVYVTYDQGLEPILEYIGLSDDDSDDEEET